MKNRLVSTGKHSLFQALALGFRFPACTALAVALAAIPCACGKGGSDSLSVVSQPNVLWIVLDAARAKNFGCYGYDRDTTPTIDALAERGVLFEQHFAQGLATTTSVPSYMTGRYFPVMNLASGTWRARLRIPPPEEQSIARIFRENGYATALITSHRHYLARECALGGDFESYVPVSDSAGVKASFEGLKEAALEWLWDHQDRPFFMYIHALDTHFPHPPGRDRHRWADPEHESRYVDVATGAPFGKEGNAFTPGDQEFLRSVYDESLAYTDARLKTLFKGLKKLDVLDSTIIIIASDHGDLLGEDGVLWGHHQRPGYDYDESMHVPLVMAGPGLPEGVRVSMLTENTDIVPSLVDLLNLKTSAEFHGASLKPAMEDPGARPVHDYVFARTAAAYDGDTGYLLRDTEWKYQQCAEEAWRERLMAVPDSLGRRLVVDAAASAEAAEAMARFRGIVAERFEPMWRAYQALSRRPVDMILSLPIDQAVAATADPGDAIAEAGALDADKDNRWSHEPQGYLWSGPGEDAPPVQLVFDVPNATYRVELWLVHPPRLDETAAAVLVKAQDDRAYTELAENAMTGNKACVYLGEYTVADERFSLVLDDAPGWPWSAVGNITFRPVASQEDPSSSDLEEREAALRALGYID